MENKYLLDLSLKYGLNQAQVSKVAAIAYQVGVADFASREFARISSYICEAEMVDDPAEEIVEELKRKGLISE